MDEPKYLNGPATAVFDKKAIVFGLDRAAAEIRTSGRAVLVEGQIDAISLHLAGLTGACGLQGSQLTPAQAELLVRVGAREAVLVPDPDGKLDLRRTLGVGLGARLPLRIAELPRCTSCGKWDPDTVVRAPCGPWGDILGARWLRETVDAAPGLFGVYLARISARGLDAQGLALAVEREVKPILALAAPAEYDLMVSEAAQALAVGGKRVGVRTLRRALGVSPGTRKRPKDRDPGQAAEAAGAGGSEPERHTDRGNALRLVRLHGSDLLYCHEAGDWYLWDGRRWARDRRGAIAHRADATIDALWTAAVASQNGHRHELLEWAKKSEDGRRIREMIRLAEHHVSVIAEEFDCDPWLLCAQNGTIDLKTAGLNPHDRRDRITKLCAVAYDPYCKTPLWLECLQRWMDGRQPLIEFLQRAAGLSLTGFVGEHVFFLCHGPGRNGKGTFLGTLQSILGDHAASIPVEALLAKDRVHSGPTPEVAGLKGQRFVVSSEPDEGVRLAEGLVKLLTGGDVLTARFLHQNPVEFDPSHKLWLAVNHLPQIWGVDEAIWSRVMKIPWDVTIPAPERDPYLKAKLRDEWPGILAWAVEGALWYHQEGLLPPPEVLTATQDYAREEDVIGRFLEEVCEVASYQSCFAGELYEAYQRWAAGSEAVLSESKFRRRLTTKGVQRGRSAIGGKTIYEGIGIQR